MIANIRKVTQRDIDERPRLENCESYQEFFKKAREWQLQFNDCSICHGHNMNNQCSACGFWGYVVPETSKV